MAVLSTDIARSFGRFELLRQLQSDGPYAHWLALDTGTGQRVEISIGPAMPAPATLPVEPGTRPSQQILACLEQGVIEAQHYRIVPHRQGKAMLSEFCRPDRTLPMEQLVSLFVKLAESLHQLHRAYGAHGVLTSASILVRSSIEATVNQPKITDYCRLRLAHGGRNPIRYRAPELGTDHPASPVSDIYSLGAIFFETLTGRLPNNCDPTREVASGAKWPSLRTFRVSVPVLLERITGKALHHNPANRYRSALEFAGDLSLLSDCEPAPRGEVSAQGMFLAARSLRCFAALPDCQLWEVIHACRWLNYETDTLLTNDQKHGGNLYAVISGSVAQFERGRMLAQLRAGVCFGAQQLVADVPVAITCYASTGTTLLEIPLAAIAEMSVACQLAVHKHLMQELTNQVRKATSRILSQPRG